jgi:hypothetical protein
MEIIIDIGTNLQILFALVGAVFLFLIFLA